MNESRSFYRDFELEELAKLRALKLEQLSSYQPIREFELGKSGQTYLPPDNIVRKPYAKSRMDKVKREVWALATLEAYPFFQRACKWIMPKTAFI